AHLADLMRHVRYLPKRLRCMRRAMPSPPECQTNWNGRGLAGRPQVCDKPAFADRSDDRGIATQQSKKQAPVPKLADPWCRCLVACLRNRGGGYGGRFT